MNLYPPSKRPNCPQCPSFGRKPPNKIATVGSTICPQCFRDSTRRNSLGTSRRRRVTASQGMLEEQVLRQLRYNEARTIEDIAVAVKMSPVMVRTCLKTMRDKGVLVHEANARWILVKTPEPGAGIAGIDPYQSRADGTYVFGAIGDTHLASKYAREDILTQMYEVFAQARVDRVFHTGNWIDGEFYGNKHDLVVHGMDAQIDYLCEKYPEIHGLDTYAVAGNDHEGWYGQREGIDIGHHCQRKMRDHQRKDWHHLGHIEAFVPLQHAKTKKTAMLHVMHPGGGSAYAVSYTVQKIVEGYEGGDKPAVLLAGHYHKMEYLRARSVCCIQTGCTQDLTPWARGKKLRYELGGWIVRLRQDAATGNIISCQVEDFPFYNRGYYSNQRWSHAGAIVPPERKRP